MADEPIAPAVTPDTTDTVSRTDHNKVQEQFRKLKAEHTTKLGEMADLSSKFQDLSALAAGLQQHSKERDGLVMQIAQLKKAAGGDITELQQRASESDDWKSKYEAITTQQPIDLLLASAGVDEPAVRDFVRREFEALDEEGRPAFDAWWTEFSANPPKYLAPYLAGTTAVPAVPAEATAPVVPAAPVAPVAPAAPAVPAPGNEGAAPAPPLAVVGNLSDVANFKSQATDPAQRKADWEAVRAEAIKNL
jgi:hypothetical protein